MRGYGWLPLYYEEETTTPPTPTRLRDCITESDNRCQSTLLLKARPPCVPFHRTRSSVRPSLQPGRQAARQTNQRNAKAARPEAAMGFSRTKLLPQALITYHHRRQPEPRLLGSLLRVPESVESFRRVGDCQLPAPAPALTASGVSNGRVLKWNGQARGWSTYAYGPGYSASAGAHRVQGSAGGRTESRCGRPLGLRFHYSSG